jgi:predicted  nucleic acid-binding Zn-ribbon protein
MEKMTTAELLQAELTRINSLMEGERTRLRRLQEQTREATKELHELNIRLAELNTAIAVVERVEGAVAV